MHKLPDDCLCEIVKHLPRFIGEDRKIHWYKQRMTLGLVCRAAWQTFLHHWGPESDKGKALLRQFVLAEFGEPGEWPTTRRIRVDHRAAVLRLAAMNDAYYQQMVTGWPEMPRQLRTTLGLIGTARHTMNSESWSSHASMRKSDYATVRRTLQGIYKRKPLHTPRESLALYLDVSRMAQTSRDRPDVAPRKATDATRLDELYVYREPEKPRKPLTRLGQDVRGFLPVRENPGVKGTLWAIRKSNYSGKSMVEYFTERVRRMKLLRAPLKRLASDLRKREKREKRKREKKKREKRKEERATKSACIERECTEK